MRYNNTYFFFHLNAGKEIGIVITTIIVSQLCASPFLGGWPSAFYVFGK
jgi:hypothetical protein